MSRFAVRASLFGLALGLARAIEPRAAAQALRDTTARMEASSWMDHLAPERRRARQLRRDALVRLLDALGPGDGLGARSEVSIDQALLRLDRAARLLPDDPDTRYFTALALARWRADTDGDGVEEHRIEEAIDAFESLRRLDPDYHPDRVAFELGVLHSRLRDHEAAAREYERAIAQALPLAAPLAAPITDRERELALLFTPVDGATARMNLAEQVLLLGEPVRAAAAYRQVAEGANDAPVTRALALWGLAIALDRSGEHREALAAASRAIQNDPFPHDDPSLGIDHRAHGPTALLHASALGIFFEPAYEIHAYDAIGREALARQLGDAESRAEQLRLAHHAWRAFLTSGGHASVYASHARAAAARIEAELGP